MRTRKKPSRTPSAFTDFAASRFLNRDRVLQELETAIEILTAERADVKAIYLFGSFARGVPTPGSDIDLLLITEESEAHVFQPYFLSVSIPVDVYTMTSESFEAKRETGQGIAGAVARSGIRLL
jgi:predicted nucleotidyltransferase